MNLLKSIWPLLPFSLALLLALSLARDASALDLQQKFIGGLALLTMTYFWILFCEKVAHDPDSM